MVHRAGAGRENDVAGDRICFPGLKAGSLCRLSAGLGLLVAAMAPAGAATETRVEPTAGAPVEQPGIAVAVGARVERTGTATRLVFELSRPVTVRSMTLENPDRIIIETSDMAFQISPDAGRLFGASGGLIRSFRFGHFAPGRSRIVIDLATPAKVQQIGVPSIAGGDPSRLVVELARCERAAFHENATHEAPPDPIVTTITATETGRDERPVVVLDPGHGGVDPGAAGFGGTIEKRVVFDFASALSDALRATGRYRVVMTRSDDSFVSLGDRVKVARDAKAALFVSVHADTLANGAADVTGATVYTASDRASDAEAARVAESENRADEAAGLVDKPDATDVSDILFDLERRETRTFSHAFQHTLAGYWQKIARLNKNPERSAGFKVLQAPDVPSVLLELGYLSNEKDVAALTSADWRAKAADSVAASIDTFFASRHPSEQADTTVDLKTGDPDRTAVVVLRPHL